MSVIRIPVGLFDEVLGNERDAGTVFELEPREWYSTRGMRAFSSLDYCGLAPGCTLRGNGATLALVAPASEAQTEVLTGGSRSSECSDPVVVSDLNIVTDPTRPTVGLHIWGAGTRVSRVNVSGVYGSRLLSVPNEGFGIILNNSGTADGFDGDCRIEDCSVGAVTNAYACAIYLGVEQRAGSTLRPSRVSGCNTYVSGGGKSHCGFGVNSRTEILDCTSQGFTRPFFSDTGSGADSTIARCSAWDVDVAVELQALGSDFRSGLVVRDCFFRFGTPAGGYVAGAVFVGAVSGVEIIDCVFEGSAAVPSYKGSGNGASCGPVRVSASTAWRGPSVWQAPQLANGAAAWITI